MSELEKTNKLSELIDGDKHSKLNTKSHQTKSLAELENEKMYPGPQLTREKLKDIRYNSLRLPTKDAHPDYSYCWLSMDPKAVPNYHDAIGTLGYTSCTVQELPEMVPYVHQTIDNSLVSGKIVYREMILCKTHKQDKLLRMEEDHHYKPLEQAADVYRKFNAEVESRGTSRAVKASRNAEFADNLEERLLVNSERARVDREATGIITEGKDVRKVHPKFEI